MLHNFKGHQSWNIPPVASSSQHNVAGAPELHNLQIAAPLDKASRMTQNRKTLIFDLGDK